MKNRLKSALCAATITAVITTLYFTIISVYGTVPSSNVIYLFSASNTNSGAVLLSMPFQVSWWWHVLLWPLLAINTVWVFSKLISVHGMDFEEEYVCCTIVSTIVSVSALFFGLGIPLGLALSVVTLCLMTNPHLGLTIGLGSMIGLSWSSGPAVGLPLATLPWLFICLYQIMARIAGSIEERHLIS